MHRACLLALTLALLARTQPLAAQETQRFLKNPPTKIGDTLYYPYLFEGHVHSQHSPDARHPVVTILQTAEQLGMDALVLTDHGSIEGRRDLADYHGSVVPFIGAEIGGQYGHAVYWNVDVDDPHVPSITSLAMRCKFAHDHGGLLVFAHPGWWIHGNPRDPMEWMTPSALRRDGPAGAIDAIELWNGVYDAPLPKLIAAWVKLLRAGVYVPIVGNSDFHQFRFHRIGDAHDIALCDTPDVSTCLWPAVRAGRVIVSDGPSAVFGVNGQPPGSIITDDRAQLDVRVEAIANEGGVLRLYVGEEIVQQRELAPAQLAKVTWTLPMPKQDTFVRIDIERPHRTRGQTSVSLLSNPVIVDVAPKRERWR